MKKNDSEMRCPEHRFRLFGKIKVDQKTNCIEVKCRECSKAYTKKYGKKVEVFHYFDLAGFVKTEVKPVKEENKERDVKNESRSNDNS